MNPRQRGELLRKRFRALGGIPFPKAKGQRIEKSPPKGNGYQLRPFPVLLQKRRCEWVSKPDVVVMKPLGHGKHRTGQTMLTRFAEKAPKKLRRNPVALAAYPL